MDAEYNVGYTPVNTLGYLTGYTCGSKTTLMKFGERLKVARQYAQLTQSELAVKSGVSQVTISKLERESDSSSFTVQLAVACGVRPEWLAMEEGEMVDGFYVSDERLKHALQIMQQLPEYAVDDAIKELDQMAKLIKRATAEAKK